MIKNLFRSLIVIVSLMFGGCHDPVEKKDQDPKGDGEITVEERMTALDRCEAKANELNNLVSPEDRIQMLTWLTTQPEFAMAGFAGEQLFAVFTDDRVLFFLHTPLDETGGRIATNGRDPVDTTTNYKSPVNARTEDVPRAKQVSLFMGLGRLFPNQPGAVDFIFSKSQSGYATKQRVATVEELKTVSGDGIFYIFTHGGVGYVPSIRRPGAESPLMTLWTTTPVTPELDTLYKEDLKNRVLAYSIATHDSRTSVKHYSITDGFVEKYMKFGPNCFIYLEACNGFSSLPGADALRQKFITQAANGKATIVGWTDSTPVDAAEKASIFLFDRLLASNTEGLGHIQIPKEDPKQRPFDLEQVFRDMYANNIGTAANGSKLVYQTNVVDDVLLRPTIEELELDEYTSTLMIKGRFGVQQGKVSVNNVVVNVTAWSPFGIACIIPETGEGSVGPVVVTTPEGIKSNAVPLTEYIIKLNYSSDDNGIKFAGVAALRIRADVHLRRSKIGETPTKPTYPDYSPESGFIFNVKGSLAFYTLTGRHYDACNVAPCHYQFTESPTPKVGTLPYTLPTQNNLPFFAMYNWGPEMKSVKISYISASVPDIPMEFEERTQCPDIPEMVTSLEMPYDAWFGFPTHEFPGELTIEIAENFNMRPGSWTKSINRATNCSATGTFKQTVDWEVIIPKHAPTDQTEARDGDNGGL